MGRCIIHIGMHKTGSTSIQNSLHEYQDDRFLYANLGNVPNHSLAVYSLFASYPERHHLHRAAGRNDAEIREYIESTRQDLERAIAATGERTLLISGEDISVLRPEDVASLHGYFRKCFDELTVVGYVRPPAAFMASGFQQRVKGGSVDRLDLEKAYRSYEKSFRKFDNVFGRHNVHLWKFDPATFRGGCVVQDFCSRLDIPLPAKRIVRLNESLSRQAVALLYTYRKLGRAYGSGTMKGPETHHLGGVLAGIGNDRFRFSPEITKPILERNRADIEWMEKRLGQSLQEDLGADRPGDVRGESDLLGPDPALVAALIGLLGDEVPAGILGETPEEVALLVHALRRKHARPEAQERGGGRQRRSAAPAAAEHSGPSMQVLELLNRAKESDPAAFEGIPDDRAAALILKAFEHVNDSLAGVEDGVVSYAGLGRFRVRPLDVARQGEGAGRSHITFHRAGAKSQA